MKRIILSAALLLLFAAGARADENMTAGVPHTIRQQYVKTGTLVADTGSADGTALIDAALVQTDNYWTGATLTIVYDADSILIDSTRTVTFFDASDDSLVFPAFSDSISPGDSFSLTLTAAPDKWIIKDSATADTSVVYHMAPGGAITSAHLIEYSGNVDSVDTKIVLQIALDPVMPNGQASWFRNDSVTYSTQDTVLYKAWGAKQCNMFRFITVPVVAPFTVVSNAVTHYGRVEVDQ